MKIIFKTQNRQLSKLFLIDYLISYNFIPKIIYYISSVEFTEHFYKRLNHIDDKLIYPPNTLLLVDLSDSFLFTDLINKLQHKHHIYNTNVVIFASEIYSDSIPNNFELITYNPIIQDNYTKKYKLFTSIFNNKWKQKYILIKNIIFVKSLTNEDIFYRDINYIYDNQQIID